MFQLRYKLAERCSNNQAEQLAIAKALEKIEDLSHLQENQRTATIHTDSKITLDATANLRNQQNLVEQIRKEIRLLEKDDWTVRFTWVKAHNNIYGNGLADQLAKEASTSREGETIYSKIPKTEVFKELKEEGVEEWQCEWDSSIKGAVTKSFFPTTGGRLTQGLQMNIKLSTTVTGHGALRSYCRRFKIIDDPTCVCKKGPQTSDHLLWECEILRKQREVLEKRIEKAGGIWPLINSDVATKHSKLLQIFVNAINLQTL